MTAMGNTEKTELTVMCMICDGTKILVQDRVNKDWPGVTFPGGHVEPGETQIILFFQTSPSRS